MTSTRSASMSAADVAFVGLVGGHAAIGEDEAAHAIRSLKDQGRRKKEEGGEKLEGRSEGPMKSAASQSLASKPRWAAVVLFFLLDEEERVRGIRTGVFLME